MTHAQATGTMLIAEAIATAGETSHIPVTFESCEYLAGPYFHGTKTSFEVGDLVLPGQLALVIDEVRTWDGHTPDVLRAMLDNIVRLREQGLDVIED